MKKNGIIIIGICLSLCLLFAGYQIKLSMPKTYYLPQQNIIYMDYRENINIKNTIADIEKIEYPMTIEVTNFESYNRYIAIMTKYDNQRYFYLFKRKMGDYYYVIHKYKMSLTDENIYYIHIDNLVFIFGYNQYATNLNISVPNSHTYIGNEFSYQNSNIMICLLDNKNDIGPIRIYDTQGTQLTEAKKCE